MNRTWQKAALALTLTGTLMGCGTENRSMESVHQPVVRRTDYVMDLPVAAGLQATDAKRLSQWLSTLTPVYGDKISVDSSQAAYNSEAMATVLALANSYGMTITPTAPVTSGLIAQGSIRVILSRMTADVPGCPDWSRPAQANLTGHNMSNYGCASNSNLAAMVADPADLLAGRRAGPGDAVNTTAKAVKTYRDGTPSGSQGLKIEGPTQQ